MTHHRPQYTSVFVFVLFVYARDVWQRLRSQARGVTFPIILPYQQADRNASRLDSVFLVRHERDFVSSPSIEDGPLTRGPTNGEAGRYVLR